MDFSVKSRRCVRCQRWPKEHHRVWASQSCGCLAFRKKPLGTKWVCQNVFFLMKGTHVVPSLSVFKAGPNTYLNFASSVIGHHPTRYTPATAKPLKRDHPPPKKYFCCHLFRSYVNFREICFKIYVNQIHRFIQLEGVFFAPRSMIS